MKNSITIQLPNLSNVKEKTASVKEATSKGFSSLKDKFLSATKSIRHTVNTIKHSVEHEINIKKMQRAAAENEIKLNIINKIENNETLTEHEQFLFDIFKDSVDRIK